MIFKVYIYNKFDELISFWKVEASNKKEAEQKVREAYPIVATDRIVIMTV